MGFLVTLGALISTLIFYLLFFLLSSESHYSETDFFCSHSLHHIYYYHYPMNNKMDSNYHLLNNIHYSILDMYGNHQHQMSILNNLLFHLKIHIHQHRYYLLQFLKDNIYLYCNKNHQHILGIFIKHHMFYNLKLISHKFILFHQKCIHFNNIFQYS